MVRAAAPRKVVAVGHNTRDVGEGERGAGAPATHCSPCLQRSASGASSDSWPDRARGGATASLARGGGPPCPLGLCGGVTGVSVGRCCRAYPGPACPDKSRRGCACRDTRVPATGYPPSTPRTHLGQGGPCQLQLEPSRATTDRGWDRSPALALETASDGRSGYPETESNRRPWTSPDGGRDFARENLKGGGGEERPDRPELGR